MSIKFCYQKGIGAWILLDKKFGDIIVESYVDFESLKCGARFCTSNNNEVYILDYDESTKHAKVLDSNNISSEEIDILLGRRKIRHIRSKRILNKFKSVSPKNLYMISLYSCKHIDIFKFY